MFASISYVPFAFCRTGSAASALHYVLRPDGTAPLFVGPNQSRISRAERLFNYDVIDSDAVGCNSNKQNDPIDDTLRGHHALASLPAGI